ncbi:MAG: RdgB/HAM1 family non-canonical purine NTP pyrophosphatase [Coriobacteriia bacterium]
MGGDAGPRRVVVATGNAGKLVEIRHALDVPGWSFLSPGELGGTVLDVEETGATFEENALIKARAYAAAFGVAALADDSGLEVDALAGAPGVRSARWAGEPADDAANSARILVDLAGVPLPRRAARFRCAIALFDPEDGTLVAHGTCEGSLAETPRGTGGFGYDPLFLPDATPGRTMAELSLAEKGEISHRGAALRALRELLVAGGRA